MDPSLLWYDPGSPRIMDLPDPKPIREEEITTSLLRYSNLAPLMSSIAAGGFQPQHPLLVTLQEDGSALVRDGIRRLAAVRVLAGPSRRSRQIPKPEHPQDLALVPVVDYQGDQLWRHLIHHLWSPDPWSLDTRMTYILHLTRDLGLTTLDISRQLGESTGAVNRLHETARIVQHAREKGLLDPMDTENRYTLSWLHKALTDHRIRGFLNLGDTDKRREPPVPPHRDQRLRQVIEWIYGSPSQDIPALVRNSQDITLLGTVLDRKKGAETLQNTRDIRQALDRTKPPLPAAITDVRDASDLLRQAQDRLATGIRATPEMLSDLRHIAAAARQIWDQQLDPQTPGRRQETKPRKTPSRGSNPKPPGPRPTPNPRGRRPTDHPRDPDRDRPGSPGRTALPGMRPDLRQRPDDDRRGRRRWRPLRPVDNWLNALSTTPARQITHHPLRSPG